MMLAVRLGDILGAQGDFMAKKFGVVYGVAVYLFFLLTFTYAIGFVENLGVPRSIDVGPSAPLGRALLIDLILLGLFAVQHSVMARPWFKRWFTRAIPRALERSTYVLAATAVLALLLWQWRPIPQQIYALSNPVAVALIGAISIVGWLVVLLSTFMIDHFDLFGIRQVQLNYRGIAYKHPEFVQSSFYRYVRHPIMAGFVVAFWAAPVMTLGHFLFAAATTGYILVGIQFEERDMGAALGETYRQYRISVPMLFPFRLGRPAKDRQPEPISPS
jgi:methanethiol S-methyltransferase